jgi:catechol 2,3-dioxygenase-like lactoylglutathione lyase family enzyme
MAPASIHHIGIPVENMEDAIKHWSAATGFFFSPIGRYPAKFYCDKSNWNPHSNDSRIAFSFEGGPNGAFIELMQFAGEGTHSKTLGEGPHHFAFKGTGDTKTRQAELQSLGFNVGANSYDKDGNLLLFFTDRDDLNNTHLEYVQEGDHPSCMDDYSPMTVLSSGETTYFTKEMFETHSNLPPGGPRIREFGLVVHNLEEAIERWSIATGYNFEAVESSENSVVKSKSARSVEGPAHICLIESWKVGNPHFEEGEGIKYLHFIDPDLEARAKSLQSVGIEIVTRTDQQLLTGSCALNNVQFMYSRS